MIVRRDPHDAGLLDDDYLARFLLARAFDVGVCFAGGLTALRLLPRLLLLRRSRDAMNDRHG